MQTANLSPGERFEAWFLLKWASCWYWSMWICSRNRALLCDFPFALLLNVLAGSSYEDEVGSYCLHLAAPLLLLVFYNDLLGNLKVSPERCALRNFVLRGHDILEMWFIPQSCDTLADARWLWGVCGYQKHRYAGNWISARWTNLWCFGKPLLYDRLIKSRLICAQNIQYTTGGLKGSDMAKKSEEKKRMRLSWELLFVKMRLRLQANSASTIQLVRLIPWLVRINI